MVLSRSGLFIWLVFSSLSAVAQVKAERVNVLPQPCFVENKGQVADQNGVPRPDVKFVYTSGNYKLILREGGFSHELTRYEKKSQPVSEATGIPENVISDKFQEAEKYDIHTSRIDVELKGANPHPQIIAEGKSIWYNNYYLAHTPEEGVSDVHGYAKVTYKNIYDKIDFVFYAKEDGELKYDIIVRPGGRLEDIQMVYRGMNGPEVDGNKLRLAVKEGKVTEEIPFSFMKETKEKVQIDYALKKGIIGLSGNYDKNQTLVIDPSIAWATYYGGTAWDWGRFIERDGSGNIYHTGYAESTSGIATSGAYQTSLGGSKDCFLVKFDSKGSRKWATYYGGSSTDEGYGISVDGSGNVYTVGVTFSNSGIATISGYQYLHAGNSDAFLVKFNSSGVRKWATYYGGSNTDQGFAVETDRLGAVYIAGYTYSTSGIASGGHQLNHGGNADAFLVKFDTSGTRKWGTYYGGSADDYFQDIVSDSSGNLYAGGFANSTSGIATSGAYQTTTGGAADAFLVKFHKGGIRLWATYYGGSNADLFQTIEMDSFNNVYLAGYTFSSSGIATSGAYQTVYGGGPDAFLVKFNSSGSRQWASYFGGSDTDYGYALATDGSGNVYLAGSTLSTSGIATSGAYQTANAGGDDAFLAKFNSSGSIQWATYYGGSGDDIGISLATDGSSYLYLAGFTKSSSRIASGGAHQSVIGGQYDAFLVSFHYTSPDAGVSSIDSLSSNYCGSTTQNIYANVTNFSSSIELDSVNIGWSINGSKQPAIKYAATIQTGDTSALIKLGSYNFSNGSYTLKVWTFEPNSGSDDNTSNDTSSFTLTIHPKPFVTFSAADACIGTDIAFNNSTTVSSDSIIAYTWHFGDGTISTEKNSSKTYDSAGTYTVKLIAATKGGCKDSASKSITIYPKPEVSFSASDACKGNPVQFNNTSTISTGSISSYAWNFGDGSTSTLQNPSHTYASAGIYTAWLVAVSSHGCKDSVSETITIYPEPKASFNTADVCLGETAQFTNASTIASGKISSYTWIFGDNTGSAQENPTHSYTNAGTYVVLLIVTSDNGCMDSVSKNITIFSLPNASFSPTPINGRTFRFSASTKGLSEYQWDFGDGQTVSGSDTISHTYSSNGSFVVTLKVSDSNGCSDSAQQNITATGIADPQGKEGMNLSIYPNPANESFTLAYDLASSTDVGITIYDLHGKEMTALLKAENQIGHQSLKVDAGSWPKGMYFIRVSAGSAVMQYKVIKL